MLRFFSYMLHEDLQQKSFSVMLAQVGDMFVSKGVFDHEPLSLRRRRF